MNFSFLSLSSATTLLYALPLLFLPYLLRERGTQVVVPALFLYEGLASSARQRLWGRLQLLPLFLLQLLILLLLILIAARPVLQGQRGSVAFVLDTSASMQALSPNGEERLFELAKKQLLERLEAVPPQDTIGLFTTAPFPVPVSLTSPQSGQSAQILTQSEQIGLLEVTDTPDPSDDVLSVFMTQLLQDGEFQQVVFFTDRPLASALEDTPDETPLAVVTVGEERSDFAHPTDLANLANLANLGITSFRLYRSPFVPNEVEATVVVEGIAPTDDWWVGIEDVETGTGFQAEPNQVNQASQTSQPWTFSFPRLPLATTYRAWLLVKDELDELDRPVKDGLAIDNEAYAVLPPLTDVSVLLVTPSPAVARGLSQIPYLKFEQVTPQEYDPEIVAHFPVVIFHLTAPESLPPTNAAFLLPPEGNALFPLGQAAGQPDITQWTVGHPLASYVNFGLLQPAFGQAFLPLAWSTPVIHATVGPVVVAGEQRGYRYAAVGFDLLPYLGKRNLPASILTLNLLGWLAGQASQPPSLKTGASLALRGASAQVQRPDGTPLSTNGESVLLLKQGVYRVTEQGDERQLAVNLSNPQEVQLGRPIQLAIATQSDAVSEQTADRPAWPWIIVAVLLFLGIERWLGTRSEQSPQTV